MNNEQHSPNNRRKLLKAGLATTGAVYVAPQVLATSVAGALAGTEMCLTTVPFDLGEVAIGPLSFVESPPPSHAGIAAAFGTTALTPQPFLPPGAAQVPGITVFGVPPECALKSVRATYQKASYDVMIDADAESIVSQVTGLWMADDFEFPGAIGYPVSYKLTFLCEGSPVDGGPLST